MSFVEVPIAALLVLFLGLAITSEAEPNYLYHICSNTTTFTPNSNYESNRNRLLSSLSNYSTSNNGFHNTTTGQAPDTVYGLFLCRVDLPTHICQYCVTYATKGAVQVCPFGKEIVIWYEECLLHYSNDSFFDSVSNVSSTGYKMSNSTTYPTSYQNLVRATVNDLASRAPNSTKRFAAGGTFFQWSNSALYMLAQCTQDLSPSNCQRCLGLAIANIQNVPIGARLGTRHTCSTMDLPLRDFYYHNHHLLRIFLHLL